MCCASSGSSAPAAAPLPATVRLGGAAADGLFGCCDHTLFVGSVPCSYHNGAGRIGDDRFSVLVPSDAQFALGGVEDLVIDAVDAIGERRGAPIRSLVLSTACQASFAGIDLDGIVARLAQRGVVCVRRESCRILMADGSAGSYGSGRSSVGGFCDQIAPLLAQARGGRRVEARGDDAAGRMRDAGAAAQAGAGGLLVVGAQPLSARSEIRSCGAGYPFARVEVLGDEVSFEAIGRCARAGFAVGLGQGGGDAARVVAQAIGVPWRAYPIAYDIEEVDAAYADMGVDVAAVPELARARREAVALTERALDAQRGRPLELRVEGADRPWALVRAIARSGFPIESVRVERGFWGMLLPPDGRAPFGRRAASPGTSERPRRDRGGDPRGHGGDPRGVGFPGAGAGDPDFAALSEEFSDIAQRVVADDGPGRRPGEVPVPARPSWKARPGDAPRAATRRTRSGSVNFATSGGFSAAPRRREPHAQAGRAWGYRAISECMECLIEAARVADASEREGGAA